MQYLKTLAMGAALGAIAGTISPALLAGGVAILAFNMYADYRGTKKQEK